MHALVCKLPPGFGSAKIIEIVKIWQSCSQMYILLRFMNHGENVRFHFPGRCVHKSGDMINFTTAACRIYSRLKWYKNCEYRLRLAKVIVKNKMSRFYGSVCRRHQTRTAAERVLRDVVITQGRWRPFHMVGLWNEKLRCPNLLCTVCIIAVGVNFCWLSRFVLDTGQRRGGRRRCLGTSMSPTRWTFIAKQHYKRSTSTLRLMLIAVVVFVVVAVKLRDNKHQVQTVYDAAAPAETEFSTPRRLFSRCSDWQFIKAVLYFFRRVYFSPKISFKFCSIAAHRLYVTDVIWYLLPYEMLKFNTRVIKLTQTINGLV